MGRADRFHKRATVITVSGSRGGCGKTRVVQMLLRLCPGAVAVKARTDAAPVSRLDESPESAPAGKDTARYLEAGAGRALLLTGPAEEMIPLAQALIEEAAPGVIVFETNALAEAVEPDLAVFVEADGEQKDNAESCRRAADLLVRLPGRSPDAQVRRPRRTRPGETCPP